MFKLLKNWYPLQTPPPPVLVTKYWLADEARQARLLFQRQRPPAVGDGADVAAVGLLLGRYGDCGAHEVARDIAVTALK